MFHASPLKFQDVHKETSVGPLRHFVGLMEFKCLVLAPGHGGLHPDTTPCFTEKLTSSTSFRGQTVKVGDTGGEEEQEEEEQDEQEWGQKGEEEEAGGARGRKTSGRRRGGEAGGGVGGGPGGGGAEGGRSPAVCL